MPADYDGDGKTDITVYHAGSGQWYSQRSSMGFGVSSVGRPGSVAVPGDYDGDGIVDVAVYDRSSSLWYINQSAGGVLTLHFGWNQAMPVPGDYDGDCRTDLAVYHGDSGGWYIQGSSIGFRSYSFGWSEAEVVTSIRIPDINYLPVIYPPFGDGTLWKPLNHSGGALIVLLSTSYFDEYASGQFSRFVISSDPAGEILKPEGEGEIVPDYHGRPAIRFSQKGEYYGPGSVYMVLILKDGTRQPWYIPDPAARTE